MDNYSDFLFNYQLNDEILYSCCEFYSTFDAAHVTTKFVNKIRKICHRFCSFDMSAIVFSKKNLFDDNSINGENRCDIHYACTFI